jgi:hypothetical protein
MAFVPSNQVVSLCCATPLYPEILFFFLIFAETMCRFCIAIVILAPAKISPLAWVGYAFGVVVKKP